MNRVPVAMGLSINFLLLASLLWGLRGHSGFQTKTIDADKPF